ncbi:CDP-diacylglycerol--serine O-phosphatidyltransferase [Phaeovulum vinaykumarii]|uniref:CDP-diacylglycerol--serine O-phosphatidyltransferase n=1 Tax=Phaeovulum vinaykumarii TaxID=407234 RepID=A0A1N7ME51_9RHOB|nr:CDP-diacylglycerol--serine O-phosphatidyltransferase [Phaeovulum vinaykumarii]SIS84300.1 CDP-diacylglycerol---serine O-phosphatidyltransferase [Phaeovulum vinaykumarii]SOC11694.1 CDP-diacylglycerol---serine O-phosphatidyltransferase [Phaeovulum vinaykumarii]
MTDDPTPAEGAADTQGTTRGPVSRTGEPVPALLLLPNLVTMTAMCLGLTSIRFVFAERFEIALVLLILAAVLDGLDGLIARRLRATSDFGAELDSLSDFLCFGVAPGLLIYRFSLSSADGGLASLGWVFVLVYVCCACLRLARFNVARDEPTPDGVKHFTGVPSPAGAMLALFPAFLAQAGVVDLSAAPMLVALWLGIVGALMISRIPTFSPKAMKVPRAWSRWSLLLTAVVVGMLFTRFWLFFVVADLLYLAGLLQAVRARRGRDLI